jgi:exosortase family protein XrtF
VYILFSTLYKFYLGFAESANFYPDYFTYIVGKQSSYILNGLGYVTQILPHPDEPSLKVIIHGDYVARIIEGCNGVSVLILFASFVIAFSGKLKTTLLYVLSGCVILYVVNIVRIVILSIGIYSFPKQAGFLHTVVFPAIIYGVVFLLWVFWVNRFSKLTKKNV